MHFNSFKNPIHFSKSQHQPLLRQNGDIIKPSRFKTQWYQSLAFPNSYEALRQIFIRYGLRLLYLGTLYTLLSLFFLAYMYLLFYFTILDDYPRQTGMNNVLALNPGLSMVPNPNFMTSLIYFRIVSPVSYHSMVDEMTAFLSHYQLHILGGMFADCESNRKYLNLRRSCRFDLDASGPCNLKNGFGYYEGKPCFALKLNRIYAWLPDPIGNSTGVRLKCEGLTPTDSAYLGRVCYYDMESLKRHHALKSDKAWCDQEFGLFDAMFYPFLNQANYQSPLVFVQFPEPRRHVVIWIKCYALAKNIRVNLSTMEGSVVFQLLVD